MPAVFAHGELRLYLLGLLDVGPKHGYELMAALTERFDGTYRPSAGTIYPRLARLEEEGLVHRTEEGRKSTYELTPAGRAELDARRAELDALESGITETVRQRAQALRADVTGTMRDVRAQLAAAARTAGTNPRVAETPRSRGTGPVPRAEAEALLRRFRDEVRSELRLAETVGALDPALIDTLRGALDTARDALRQNLSSRHEGES